jgi:hypothetical protein
MTLSNRAGSLPTFYANQTIIWWQNRKWGGKQAVPAYFLEYRGEGSAYIGIGDTMRKTVRLSSIVALDKILDEATP